VLLRWIVCVAELGKLHALMTGDVPVLSSCDDVTAAPSRRVSVGIKAFAFSP